MLTVVGEENEETGDLDAFSPYLARQMSRVATRTPGMKDTPFFGSARGCKVLKSTSSNHANTKIFTQVRAAVKRNTLRPALVYISV